VEAAVSSRGDYEIHGQCKARRDLGDERGTVLYCMLAANHGGDHWNRGVEVRWNDTDPEPDVIERRLP
jgi:hypothetical protein